MRYLRNLRMTHRRSLPKSSSYSSCQQTRQAQAALRANKFKTMMKFHLPGLVTSSGDVILEPVWNLRRESEEK